MIHHRTFIARAVASVIATIALALTGCSGAPTQSPSSLVPSTLTSQAGVKAPFATATATPAPTMTEQALYVAGSGAYGIVAWALFFYSSTHMEIVGMNDTGQPVWAEIALLNSTTGQVAITTHSASGSNTYVDNDVTNTPLTAVDAGYSAAASKDFGGGAGIIGHGPLPDVARHALSACQSANNVSLRPMTLTSCYSAAQGAATSGAEVIADEHATYSSQQEQIATIDNALSSHARNVITTIQACQDYIPGGYVGMTWCYTAPAGNIVCVSAPDVGEDSGTGGFFPLGDGTCSVSIDTETVNCIIKI